MNPLNPQERAPWEQALTRNQYGIPRPTASNALHVLSAHPAWAGVLAFDEFRRIPVMLSRPPFDAQTIRLDRDASDLSVYSGGLPVEHHDLARTQVWFERTCGITLGRDTLSDVVALASKQTIFHPIREYFATIKWDNYPRLDYAARTYFGAAGHHHENIALRMWMVSAVARILSPGCQADYLVVLEGPQGIGKSTGLQLLAGEQWYLSTNLDLESKEIYMAMQGKWIIEFAEFSSLKKADILRRKEFFSEKYNSYVPKFENLRVDLLRQCVFASTTNESAYLADPSGDRRYWPIACTRVDRDSIQRDRDQLWAEAVAIYLGAHECEEHGTELAKRGDHDASSMCTRSSRCQLHAWWPIGADHDMLAAAQAERYDADIWTTAVTKYLAESTRSFHATRDILNHLGIETPHQDRRNAQRIASIMRQLGYENATGIIDGQRARGWRLKTGPNLRPTT